MAERATITHAMAFFALLFATLHLQAQGGREAAAAGGQAGAAEYALLEPKPERLPAAVAVGAVNATDSKPVCGHCWCCLSNTNPQVCLTTCCFRRTCSGSVCLTSPRPVSCGCNGCDYPAGKK